MEKGQNHGERLIDMLDAIQVFLETASELAPRNAPAGKVLQPAIEEFQKMVANLIEGDMTTARKMIEVVDSHSLARLDERIDQHRAVELTRAMTKVIRETSK